MKKEVNIGFIFLGFSLSYLFFGMTLLQDYFSEITKLLTGIISVFVGILFLGIALTCRDKKKTKKT